MWRLIHFFATFSAVETSIGHHLSVGSGMSKENVSNGNAENALLPGDYVITIQNFQQQQQQQQQQEQEQEQEQQQEQQQQQQQQQQHYSMNSFTRPFTVLNSTDSG